MGFLNAKLAGYSSAESSERSNSTTESESQTASPLSIQDLVESDTQPAESDMILVLSDRRVPNNTLVFDSDELYRSRIQEDPQDVSPASRGRSQHKRRRIN
jgi:hypothetical protein